MKSSVRSSLLNEELTRRKLSRSSRACAAVVSTRRMSGHRRRSSHLLHKALPRVCILRSPARGGYRNLETTETKLLLLCQWTAKSGERRSGNYGVCSSLWDVGNKPESTRKRDPSEARTENLALTRKCDLGHVVSPARIHSAGVGSIHRSSRAKIAR